MAVVERFKQELMYGLSAGTKKSGRCREVAIVERWPLVEVRLYVRATKREYLKKSVSNSKMVSFSGVQKEF